MRNNISIKETDEAKKDIRRNTAYIFDELHNEQAGAKFFEGYGKKVEGLRSFPYRYRGISVEYRGYEIRLLPYHNYNIFFVVREDVGDVVVLRVLHQLQNWRRILRFDDYHIDGDVL